MKNRVEKPDVRNQYLISSKGVKSIKNISKIEKIERCSFGNYNLYWHNSLDVSRREVGGVSGLLIGNAIDPLCPKKGNKDVLFEVINKVGEGVRLGKAIFRYSGRFVFSLCRKGEYFLLNDAGATRPIKYSNIKCGVIASSSESLILYFVGKQPIYNDRKKEFDRESEFWIGARTRDERINKLLPNNYLYLNEMKVKRLGIGRCKNYQSNVYKLGDILRGTILGLNERFDLKIGLTSGVDSRMILAASEPISEEVEYFLFKRDDVANSDVKVANKMANKLELNFKLLEANRKEYKKSGDFEGVINKSWIYSRSSLLGNILSINHNFNDCAVITGVMGEVFRCFYPSPYKNYTVERIFECAQVARNEYSASEIKKWLESVRGQIDKYRVDVMDLFYWEQKVGNWGARSFVEYDLVTDTFSPFSNRMFILGMLSLPREGRRPPRYESCRRIVKSLWPACDKFSYNPGLYSLSKGWLQSYADKNPIFLKLYNSLRNIKQNN